MQIIQKLQDIFEQKYKFCKYRIILFNELNLNELSIHLVRKKKYSFIQGGQDEISKTDTLRDSVYYKILI